MAVLAIRRLPLRVFCIINILIMLITYMDLLSAIRVPPVSFFFLPPSPRFSLYLSRSRRLIACNRQ